jgi:hypothetical protein
LKQIQNETDKILVKGKFAGHPKLPTIVRANDSIWLGLRSDNRHIKDVTSNTLMALDRSVAHVILQAMKWRQGLKTMCCCYLRSHTSRASMNGRCVTPRGRTKEKETKQKRRPRKSHCSSLPRDTGLSSLPSEHASVSQFGWSCCLSRSFHLLCFLPSFQGGRIFSWDGFRNRRAVLCSRAWEGTVTERGC